VHAAGVLSHYYTDPLQPLHTAQSEAENNIHRAVEWSISRAYDELARQGEAEFANISVDLPAGPNWLAQLVCRNAERAHRDYEKLIAHYDIQRGVVDPPAGLDRVARRLTAELIRYAAISYGAVLNRAIEEANVHPPSVPLAGATISAIGQVPFKLIAKRIADKEERRLVERMYDELIATGTVEAHLAEDDRAVRDLHAVEVLAKRPPQPTVAKVFPFKAPEQPVTRPAPDTAAAAVAVAGANVVPLRPAPQATEPEAATGADEDTHIGSVGNDAANPGSPSGLLDRLERMSISPLSRTEPAPEAEPRFHLTLDHDVVDGPAIGPKTAARLYPHGIKTVGDLLKAEPVALAQLVSNRHVTPEVISDWQEQARLVCTVPGLRGTHAQLLVGAGYRTADAVAAADADKLCADILAFAATQNGQRLLRNGDPPDIEKIKGWLEAARSVKAA
jgi:hypothetical protein